MRSDIVPGALFPDYELPDHRGTRRTLTELQHVAPLVLVLSREASARRNGDNTRGSCNSIMRCMWVTAGSSRFPPTTCATPEGCVDDLARAPGINNATLAVGFERGFDARFILGRQRRRFIFDGLDDVPARREFAELRRNVFARFQVTTRRRRGMSYFYQRPSVAVSVRAPYRPPKE